MSHPGVCVCIYWAYKQYLNYTTIARRWWQLFKLDPGSAAGLSKELRGAVLQEGAASHRTSPLLDDVEGSVEPEVRRMWAMIEVRLRPGSLVG